MKKNTIIILLCAVIFILMVQILTSCMNSSRLYPQTGKIIGINEELDLVTFETSTGIKYQFRGAEDYAVDDCIAVVMDKNGTVDVSDDSVIMARYSSWNIGG